MMLIIGSTLLGIKWRVDLVNWRFRAKDVIGIHLSVLSSFSHEFVNLILDLLDVFSIIYVSEELDRFLTPCDGNARIGGQ